MFLSSSVRRRNNLTNRSLRYCGARLLKNVCIIYLHSAMKLQWSMFCFSSHTADAITPLSFVYNQALHALMSVRRKALYIKFLAFNFKFLFQLSLFFTGILRSTSRIRGIASLSSCIRFVVTTDLQLF